jgi:putative transposase
MPFHVLNRGVNKQTLFYNEYDYAAFEGILSETLEKTPIRILAYCLMPNHWHFVLWPEESEQLAAFMQRLTITHATRWQKHYDRVGLGHVYQGRFKSFPIETEEYLYRVLRYVERNALRAGLVERAEEWPWSSLWIRSNQATDYLPLLSDWPISPPVD